MKKRVLSLFLALTLCLTLTPTGALAAEGQPPEQTVSVTQEAQITAPAAEEEEEEKKTTSAENGADENDPPANPEENPTENAPAAAEKNTANEESGKQAGQNEPTVEGKNEPLALDDASQNAAGGENGEAGDTSISEADTRTEIWCVGKPDSIARTYDGTTDGGTISLGTLGFTDGENSYKLTEGTDFTATKTFDSEDAGDRTVTVALELIDDAAAKYKLKAGTETFTIEGRINKAYPKLTVSLSKTTCTVGKKILPLLSVSGVQENAAVTYYYAPFDSGYLESEGTKFVPAIDGNTAISEPGIYYVYAKTAATQNYEEDRSATVALTVSACDHGGAEGFDKSATTCPDCGVAAVAETALSNGEGRRFADLQTAIDADRDGGSTLKLLADVTGNYTIDGTKDTGLELNGHSIKGTVTVKGIKGDYITTTLSNTENTTTASIDEVVAFDGAELAGSGFPAVIGTLTLADGATWKNILNLKTLGYKVLNGDGTYQWYAPDDVKDSQLSNVIINSLPITTKTLNLKVNGTNVNKVERGTTVQLCASCNKDAEVTFSILKKGETTPITLTEPSYASGKYTKDYSFDTIGEYTIYFTATKDGYTVQSAKKKLTVIKPNLSNAEITFRSSNESTYEPYRSTTTAPGFTVTYNGKTLKLGVDYTASGTASSAGVSTQTLTIKAVEGSDYTGSKTAEWRIVPHKAKVEVGDVIKAYDGTTDLPDGKISLVSAAGSAGYQAGLPLPLSEGNGFELTDAKYDSANASETEKNISFTVKLTDTNYTFEDGTTQKDFTLNGTELNDKTFQINKATIDPSHNRFEQTVFNDLAKTYEIELNQFLDKILPAGGEYGDIKYGRPSVFMDSDYYTAGGATIENGKLSLSINKAASSNQGDEIGTVTVQVETTNYQPFTLTIHVSLQDKLVPVLAKGNTVSASEITYGQTLADSKLAVNGTMKDPNTSATVDGTFTWTDGTIKPDAGSYDAEWTFTPAEGYEEYATATGTVTVKVKPAKLIVSVKASSMYYTGEEQIASIIASGQSVDSTPVTFTYSDKEDGNYTSGVPTFTDAGTYTVYYKAEAANHEPATGTFTVTIVPLPISLRSVSSISKTYDGSADVTLTADKLTFFSITAKATNIKLPDTALTFSDAQFTKQQADRSYLPSPEVGNGKALSFTMTLTSKNYVFEGESEGTTEVSDVFATDDANRFTITKAAAPTVQPVELTIYNGVHKTYSIDLSTLLPKLTAPCDYGTITYDKKVYTNLGVGSFITLVNGKTGELTLEANRSGTDEGQFGTITVTISTSNYQDITLTVKVSAVNQITPVPEDGKITASKITYGQALSDSTITGTMQDPATGDAVDGTFTWDTPDVNPNAGSYDAKWTFTPNKSYGGKYTTNTGTATVTVNPKAVTVSITPNGGTYGSVTAAVAELFGAVEGDNVPVTLTYTGTANDGTEYNGIAPPTKAGTYTVTATITDRNYTLDADTATAKFTVAKRRATVTPDNKSKVYEEKDPDLTYKVDGVLDGETLQGITLTRAEGENAGEYAITATADAGANPNYEVTFAEGKFTIEPKSIKGATVVLGKGLAANGAEQTQTVEKVLLVNKELPADSYTVTGNTATAHGIYTLTVTGKGNYTGTVEQTYVIVPTKAEDAPGEEIAIGNGKVKVVVKSEGTVPPATLLTDKAELLAMLVNSGDITADELVQIADGAIMDIVLTVKEVNVPDEVKTAMAQAAKGCTIGQYLDISLFKYMTVNGSQQAGVALRTTKNALTISVAVPDALINTNSAVNRTYCIVRRHDGAITVLDAAFDAASKTLTFKTDRFSIYAIAYKDTAVPSSSSKPSSNNSSNDSETKKNEVAAPTPTPTPASTSKPSTITAMPQTGDTSNPTLYVVLLVASLLGLAVVFVCKRRNNK